MVRCARTCFVPGCTFGYKSSQKRNSERGVRNKSLFKAANEHQLGMWRRVIPRQDKVLRETDVVCELHFSEDSIIRNFERSMPDGSAFKLGRRIPALKSDAIPSIFPNLPKYLTTVEKKRKPPKVRESSLVEKTVARTVEMPPGSCISPEVDGDVCGSGNDQVTMPGVNNILLLADVATQMLLLEQEVSVDFSVDSLLDGLHKITLPGAHWGSAVVGKNVIFLSVGQSLTVEKTVVLSSDLNVKVTLRYKEVSISEVINTIKDVDEVAHILLRVDGLHVCEGASGVVSHGSNLSTFKALRKGSEEWRTITEFLDYLQLWEVEARGNGFNFLSHSTTLGLKVTLRSTLELLSFLEDECNYHYLMTARLNQDALERFFGMMRSACGSNDHPASNLFIQLFRLLSTYSLVKPPRGSSVSGGDVLSTLVNSGEGSAPGNRSGVLQGILDAVVEKGTRAGDLDGACSRQETDHSYCESRTPDFVLSHFSGYVARRIMTLSKCEACHGCLISSNPGREGHEMFTAWQSEGHLTFASERLLSLVTLLEEAALSVLTKEQLNIDIVFSLATAIEELSLPLLGCDRHCHSLTEAIVRYYICTRVHFACRQANAIDNAHSEYTRLQRKKGKL